MKKNKLKRKLEIAIKCLKRYEDFMIDGVKYADKALFEIDMIDNIDIIANYWLEYYINPETGLCGLCGNTGKIHIESVRNPSGRLLKSGFTTYCICPNGQSYRANQEEK